MPTHAVLQLERVQRARRGGGRAGALAALPPAAGNPLSPQRVTLGEEVEDGAPRPGFMGLGGLAGVLSRGGAAGEGARLAAADAPLLARVRAELAAELCEVPPEWVGPPLPTRDAPADNRSPETAAAVGESERFLEAYTPSCVRKSLPNDMRDLVQDAPLPMGIVPWIGAGGDDGDSGAAAIADPDEIADGAVARANVDAALHGVRLDKEYKVQARREEAANGGVSSALAFERAEAARATEHVYDTVYEARRFGGLLATFRVRQRAILLDWAFGVWRNDGLNANSTAEAACQTPLGRIARESLSRASPPATASCAAAAVAVGASDSDKDVVASALDVAAELGAFGYVPVPVAEPMTTMPTTSGAIAAPEVQEVDEPSPSAPPSGSVTNSLARRTSRALAEAPASSALPASTAETQADTTPFRTPTMPLAVVAGGDRSVDAIDMQVIQDELEVAQRATKAAAGELESGKLLVREASAAFADLAAELRAEMGRAREELARTVSKAASKAASDAVQAVRKRERERSLGSFERRRRWRLAMAAFCAWRDLESGSAKCAMQEAMLDGGSSSVARAVATRARALTSPTVSARRPSVEVEAAAKAAAEIIARQRDEDRIVLIKAFARRRRWQRQLSAFGAWRAIVLESEPPQASLQTRATPPRTRFALASDLDKTPAQLARMVHRARAKSLGAQPELFPSSPRPL